MGNHSVTVVFPENRKELDDKLFKHLSLCFKEFHKNQLEDLLKIQTDEKITFTIKERLLAIYAEDLEKDDYKFEKLFQLILLSELAKSEKEDILFSVRTEAIQKHLYYLSFPKLVEMYSMLIKRAGENDNDYESLIVDTFAVRLVDYASKIESMNDIQKVCNMDNDYAWEKIGLEIEKKLGVKFAE